MTPESIFLIAKFVIALLIASSSLVAIVFGFRLISKGKSGAQHRNSISILGFKANVSSLGALMIVSGIGLAVVAKTVLPSSIQRGQDGAITIAQLEQRLIRFQAQVDSQAAEITSADETILDLEKKVGDLDEELVHKSQALEEAESRLAEAGSAIASMEQKHAEIEGYLEEYAQLASQNEAGRELIQNLKEKLSESEALNAEFSTKIELLEAELKKLRRD